MIVVFLIIITFIGILFYILDKKITEKNSSNRIFHNIFINNVDVSNLLIEEAEKKLIDNEKMKLAQKQIILDSEGIEEKISYEELDLNFDFKNEIQKAYDLTRKGNIFEKLSIINSLSKNSYIIKVDDFGFY